MKLRSCVATLLPARAVSLAVLIFAITAPAALRATTCDDWKSVRGWQGTYTLSSNGSFTHGGINMFTIDETSGATVGMLSMTDGLCNQLRWQGADLNNTGSVNDSTQVLNACMQGEWFTTDTLVGNAGFPSNSELEVDFTDGTFSFQPISHDFVTHTIYNCQGSQSGQESWGTGPASNWPLNFQLPSQVGPLTATNYGFLAKNNYAGYQDIQWMFTFNLSPIPAGYNKLTVTTQGMGTVTSTDGTINCPGVCSWYYAPTTQVTLNATPGQGYTFLTWTGACSGTGPCTVTMSQDQTVNAIFSVPLQFFSAVPCRVVDTRNPDGQFGGPTMQGGTQRSFPFPQGNCNIPTQAQAYSLNVTVVPQQPLNYLTIWPTGQNQPLVSTMNSYDGRVKANAAIVPAGDQGAVSVYVTGTTDVILDINGYFVPPGNGTSQFFALPPCRVIDTRNPNDPLGGPYLMAGVQRDFPVQNSPCMPGPVGGLIGNGDGSFQPEVNYSSGVVTSTVIAADLNGDGKPDLITANNQDNVVGVLLGNGNGTFQAPLFYDTGGSFADAVAVGDFNADGKADVVVASYFSDNVGVLLGNGDGTLRTAMNYPTGQTPRAVAVGDFNGDGHLDLVTADAGFGGISVLLGNGDGSFQAPINISTGGIPYSLVVADFNHDGKLDVAAANYMGDTVSLFLGNGNGTFHAPVSYGVGSKPYSVAVGDLNLDGKRDLVTANYGGAFGGGGISVLLGNGDGTFQQAANYGVGYLNESVVIADFNGDGKPDIALATQQFLVQQGLVGVLLGNGDGTFQGPLNNSVGLIAYSVAAADFNGDGKADIAVAQSLPLLNFQIQAYSFNATVVPHTHGQPLNYLTLWPQGESQPFVSTLNNPTGTVVANAAIVPAGNMGAISAFAYNDTDLIVDINGYFAAPAGTGLSFYPATPCRAYDSRNNGGQPFQGTRAVNIGGSQCAPPRSAQAYVTNATVVPRGFLNYLTVWPEGELQPLASTLNAQDGFVTSNMAIAPNLDGSIDAYASQLTHLIMDISGYFAP